MPSMNGISGKNYKFSNKLGEGGEGDVYELESPDSDKVIKVYTKLVDSVQTEKIRAMLSYKAKTSDFMKQLTWPIDIVLSANQNIYALIMERVNGVELSELRRDGEVPWNIRIKIAMNFCLLVHAIHEEGQVIGDFNGNNFEIDLNTGRITMIDADSIHFTDTKGKIFRCPVVFPDVCSPELIDTNIGAAPLPTFSRETDYFALAIHIFQLLTFGWHPYSAAIIQSGRSVPSSVTAQNPRMKKGITPFFRPHPDLQIPPDAPEVQNVFPQGLINLFEQTFITGHMNPTQRVHPREWYRELKKLSANLKTCSNHHEHIYYSNLPKCPWCTPAMLAAEAQKIQFQREAEKKRQEAEAQKIQLQREAEKKRQEAEREQKLEAIKVEEHDKLKLYGLWGSVAITVIGVILTIFTINQATHQEIGNLGYICLSWVGLILVSWFVYYIMPSKDENSKAKRNLIMLACLSGVVLIFGQYIGMLIFGIIIFAIIIAIIILLLSGG